MSEGTQHDQELDNQEVVERIKEEADGEIDLISQTLPSLKGQLIKWAVRSIFAYGLARSVTTWKGGPDWLMPVTYLYIVISLLLALVIWWVSRSMIEKSRRTIAQKTEDLRVALDAEEGDVR
ncbi:hypothetical protein [Aliiroseovarius sp. PrR006]|uniref:hypothetical protein n=1 Tax=Aliiroseovarius sp. PrR006 TaxID=2706883 RepID=UPI0013D1CFD0|nr:hypothetical protein [Aliiroseovarius sp. PrR006]NDW53924.1 hypothetical protein [Aliiroseovarius sp. PrR006]